MLGLKAEAQSMMYTIIDVETTGPSNRMTEISVFKFDGNQVIDEFTSLINPEAFTVAIPVADELHVPPV